MSKFWALAITLYGLLLLLAIAGVPMGAESIMTSLSPTGLKIAIGALAALCISGMALAIVTKTSPDLYIAGTFAIATMIPLFLGFNAFISYAESNLSNWVYQIIRIIFLVLGATYLVLAADWVMNRGSN